MDFKEKHINRLLTFSRSDLGVDNIMTLSDPTIIRGELGGL